MGFLSSCSIGYSYILIAYMVFLLQNNYTAKNVKPALILTYTFLFAVAMTAMWEMWEFSGDMLLGLNSQGGSLTDTMQDIIAGSTGPLIMLPFFYFYLKGSKNKIFSHITQFIYENNANK